MPGKVKKHSNSVYSTHNTLTIISDILQKTACTIPSIGPGEAVKNPLGKHQSVWTVPTYFEGDSSFRSSCSSDSSQKQLCISPMQNIRVLSNTFQKDSLTQFLLFILHRDLIQNSLPSGWYSNTSSLTWTHSWSELAKNKAVQLFKNKVLKR